MIYETKKIYLGVRFACHSAEIEIHPNNRAKLSNALHDAWTGFRPAPE
jgi:hypothetical protein